jgi:hypothetical protein
LKDNTSVLGFVNVTWLTQQSADMTISVVGWLHSTNMHSKPIKFLSLTVFIAQIACFLIEQAIDVNFVYLCLFAQALIM